MLGKSYLGEHLHGFLLPLLLRHAPKGQRHGHIFQCGILGQKVIGLEDESDMFSPEADALSFAHLLDMFAADHDLPLGGRFETCQQV